MPELPFHTDDFNEQVRAWAGASRDQVRAGLMGIGARRTGTLIREFKMRTGMQFGRINRVTFAFPRQLVWIEKGAGVAHTKGEPDQLHRGGR